MKRTTTGSGDSRTQRCLGIHLRSMLWACVVMVICSFGSLKASHYAGFEYQIDKLPGANENYSITFKIYRDCRGIALANPHTMQLVRLSNNTTQTFSVTRTSVTDITPLCPGQVSYCTVPTPGARGITENVYTQVVNNLVANENYRVQSTNSARNGAITTGAANQLMFIYANFRTGMTNSSPRFLNRPIADFCVNQPATFSPNGFDPDGDAIVYALQNCLENNINDPVTYNPGFSGTTPVTSSTGVNLNPNTGALTFTPTVSGQVAIICLRADEFRNGVLIGSVVRDMQINILPCSNTPPVVTPIPNQVVQVGQTFCTPVTATDVNGDLITLTAVSGIIPPATFVQLTSTPGAATGTFCFTPTLAHVGQTFTVTINAQDNACPAPGTGSTTFNITVPLPCNMTATATATPTTCAANNGTATVVVQNGTFPISYSWTGPSGYTSTNQTITGLAPGQYSVLVVDGNSCVAYDTVIVGQVGGNISATATTTPASCNQNNGTITINATGGVPPYLYSVDGGPLQLSNTFTGLATGTHTFHVQDVNGCAFDGTAAIGQLRDTTPPVITCPANITVNNDPGQCGAVVTFASATATDDCGPITITQTGGGASGSFFPTGTSTITFTATDGAGNSASCSFTITVIDNENPTITCPGNITVNNDLGHCSAVVTYPAPTVTDNCIDNGVTVTQVSGIPSGGTFPVGTTTNVFQATDASGNTATCSFTVTVLDAEPPVITCPANITQSNDPGQCSAVVTYTVTATDNCSATTTVTPPSGSVFLVGTTTVTGTATDPAGNTATCTFTVTVVDNEPPTAVCQNVTVALDSNGNATITAADIDGGSTDNCGPVTLAASNVNFNCDSVPTGGAPTELFFSEYIEGSSNNKCLEIYNGTAAPIVLTGTYDIAMYFNGSTTPGLIIPLTGTIAPGDVFVVCQSGAAPQFLAQADQTNSSGWYNGDDAIELRNVGMPIDIIGSIGEDPGTAWTGGGNSTLDRTLVRNGNVNGGNTSNTAGFPAIATEWTGQPNNTSSFLGSHMVTTASGTATLTVTDASGNTSTCTATVVVEDNQFPSAVCQNTTVTLDANGNATVTAVMVNGGSEDNCGISSITVQPNSFNCSNVGMTNTVTLTVTDQSGNSSTCTATVTVVDNTPPTALCQNLTVTLDGNGQASVTASDVDNGSFDNCGIQSLAVNPSTFDCGDVGTPTQITELFISEYIEGSGNNKCIEIYNGTGAAVNLSTYELRFYFNGNTAPNTTINLSGTVAAGDVFVVCQALADPQFLAQADQTSGAAFFNGDDAVVLANNAAPIDIMGRIGEDPGTEWSVAGNTTMDNTLIRNASVTSGNTANAPGFPSLGTEWTQFANDFSGNLGTHSVNTGAPTVTLTVTDVNGNTSTCSATVTVEDNTPPTIVCPAPIVMTNDPGQCGAVVTYTATATDNCAATVTYDIAPGSFFPVGTTTVTATATDPSGNTATCSFTVTVTDNENPTVTCPANITVNNDPGQCSAVVNYTAPASDNCGIASVVGTPPSGTAFPVGTTPVVVVATDIYGNTAACTFTVTVIDNEAPVANCVNITVALDSAGNATITSGDINGGSTDNCGIATLTVDPSSFNCSNVGANTVTLTVTDVNGNSSTCTSSVTVEDNVPPVAICQNITVTAPPSGTVIITPAQIDGGSFDACGIASITIDDSTFSCGNQGGNTVTLTVTDVNGNVSTCTATVTVNPTPIVVTLTSPVDACGFNVSTCCGNNGSGGHGSHGSCGGHGDHGSNGSHGSDPGHHGSGGGWNGSGHGHGGHGSDCRYSQGHGNGGHGNGGHGHGGWGSGNLGSGHGGGHGHGGHGSGNLGSGHHGSGGGGHHHGGCGSGNMNPCGRDGRINTTASGGCGNLTFQWNTGATTPNLTGLTPGTYTVTVTDANGNTATASITLTQAAPLAVTTTVQNVSCKGARDGCATANATGGCAPYTYNWSNGAHTPTICNLRPGTYRVTVVDGYGCTATASATVTEPSRLVVDAGSHKVVFPAYAPQACATLTGTVSGGTAPYSTSWRNRQGVVLATGNTVTVCPTATTVYYFHATDAHGCSGVDSVAVCVRNISCGNNKIQICHEVPGRCGYSQNLCIPVSQVASHLSHGDKLGTCGSSNNCSFPSNHGNGHGNNNCKTDEQAGAASDDDMTMHMSINAFPNPTNGDLTVELACQNCEEDATYRVKVSDIYGHQVAEVEVTISVGEASAKLDLSQFAAGVYMITVDNGMERLVERIVKQ